MRDIGKSRRKERRHPQVCLEVPKVINNAPREPARSKEENGVGSNTRKRPNETPTRTDSHMQPQYQLSNDSSDMQLPALDRTWTGRIDPFVKFPV